MEADKKHTKELQPIRPTLPEESKEMLKKYKQIMYALQTRGEVSKPDKEMIKKAFRLAVSAHNGMRRKGGDPYIYHPLEVARICVSDIGLGPTAVTAALLHDVVEDTDYTLTDIKSLFGDRVTLIVDGLTKIKEFLDNDETRQKAFNHQKIIFTLASDVRVILIKLADRLHNMRTLDSMPRDKQIKISNETQTFFSPLAHRLGLYVIKTELENLAFKYLQPVVYENISNKLNQKIQERNPDIKEFILPIKKALATQGFSFEIKSREKSVYSIFNKMVRKSIDFDAVQDIFAVRVIIDVPFEEEKDKCWAVYSIVSNLYRPNIERLRDWISTPKSNGYQALHTTVMSDFGEWVEVQIRSKRMDEIAEKGYAAHWKYKGEDISNSTKNLDHWLDRIRDMLQNPQADINEFMESFRGFLFTDEVFVFTPKGELRILPTDSTVLDFAYAIHSSLGDHCIGAEVNHHLKPLNYQVQNGDQIKILDSTVQTPKEEWLKIVKTSRAQSAVLDALKRDQKKQAEVGEKMLQQILDELEIDWKETEKKSKTNSVDPEENKIQIKDAIKAQFVDATKSDILSIYRDVATGVLGRQEIQTLLRKQNKNWFRKINLFRKEGSSLQEIGYELSQKNDNLRDVNKKDLKYVIADCCNPIPGDDIIAIPNLVGEIEIHRAYCKKIPDITSENDNQLTGASWQEISKHEFLTEIYIQLIDTKGILFEITKVLLQEMDVNLKTVNIDSTEGVAYCKMKLFVNNLEHLTQILERLREIDGVKKVYRWYQLD
ncbi:MAG: RelA/SpoT family protein [Bacteroidales bacterium]|nr:RelA/SpoT family protein [Bacteroidales bacterium]